MSTTTPEEVDRDERQRADEAEERVRQLEAQLRQARGPASQDPEADTRPWAVAQDNAAEEHTRDVAPLPYEGPGAVFHHFPHLTGGSGGPQVAPYVRAVAELLAKLGYATNGVISGRLRHFDDSLAADINRFKLDHNIRENVAAYSGHPHPAEEIARNLVGPYTIQALFDKVAEKTGEDVRSLVSRTEYEVSRLLP